MPNLATPKHKWVVWLLAVGNLLAMPLVEEVYYRTNLRRGAYPPEADSIGIPIMQFMAGWVITLPVFLALIWFGFREYPGAVSFLAFNKKRPVWSGVWSFLLVLLAVYEFYFAIKSVAGRFPLDAAHALFTLYLLLCFRSSVVFSTAFQKRIGRVDDQQG